MYTDGESAVLTDMWRIYIWMADIRSCMLYKVYLLEDNGLITEYFKKLDWRRVVVMCIGTIFIAMGVAIFKFAALGNDPFNAMSMALGGCTPITYANWCIIVNGGCFLIQLLLGRHYIGLGTVVNALFQGYIVTFFYFLFTSYLPAPGSLWVKLLVMCIGVIVCCLGISLYQTADVGVAPYDSISLIMTERLKKVPYFWCRISNDAICAIVAYVTGGLVGIGTVVCAFGLGSVTHFFNKHFTEPLLAQRK